MRTLLWPAVVGLGLMLGRVTDTAAQGPPELRSAAILAEKIEAAQASLLLAGDLEDELDLAMVEAELEKVAHYLASHPDDVGALLLTVRLGRVRDLLAFQDQYIALLQDPSAGEPTIPSTAPHLEVLDRILARDSSVAEAHYWKARLVVEEGGRQTGVLSPFTPAPVISNQAMALALTEARAAVAHDPSRPRYRELLAMLLLADDQVAGAVEVLDHPSTVDGLMSLLARDLLAFAPPPSAEVDPILVNFIRMVALMGAADSGRPEQALHLELRAHGWSASTTMEEVQRYYQDRWPGLRFFAAEGWDGGAATAFVMEDRRWRAVRTEAEHAAANRSSDGNVILLVLPSTVYEQLRRTSSAQGLPPGAIPVGDRVGILLMNGRRSPG